MEKLIKQTVYVKEIHHYDWLVKSHNDDLIDHVKQQEGYFLTSEQLNQLLSDVIKDTLNTAVENAYIDNNHQQGGCMDADDFEINKESIINQHKNILKKWKI